MSYRRSCHWGSGLKKSASASLRPVASVLSGPPPPEPPSEPVADVATDGIVVDVVVVDVDVLMVVCSGVVDAVAVGDACGLSAVPAQPVVASSPIERTV